MAQEAGRRNGHTLVLLIPTKESVFSYAISSQGGGSSQTLTRLLQNERTCKAEILACCNDAGIACVDLLGDFQQALARGLQTYSTTTESHPNGLGYELVARVALARLRELGWLERPAAPNLETKPAGAPTGAR
jgi:hypothetical protein